jgi:hypothetical protein
VAIDLDKCGLELGASFWCLYRGSLQSPSKINKKLKNIHMDSWDSVCFPLPFLHTIHEENSNNPLEEHLSETVP